MNNIISDLYRKLLPTSLRKKIYNAFLGDFLEFYRSVFFVIKSRFLYSFSKVFTLTNEKDELWSFLGRYGLTHYPGNYALKYRLLDVTVLTDNEKRMQYVIHNSNRLYFPSEYSSNEIKEIYKGLRIEQDEDSPHRYVKSYNELKGKILLDIGSAEGVFALDVIELVEHAYLFECDKKWIKALEATFAPWGNKVSIVERYVSNTNDKENITIDYFFDNRSKNNLFIKMDIEGYELSALEGASKTFEQGQNLGFSICVYHRENDILSIPSYLSKYNYQYEFTKGYLFMSWQLRKGIVRSK